MPERRHLHPRSVLVAVFAIGMLPLLLAAVLNVFAPQWRPWGMSNKGELIEPPRLLSVQGLQGLDEQPLEEDLLSRRWTMMVIGALPCEDDCQSQIDKLGRVIRALGKDAPRVQRLLVLSPGGTSTSRLAALAQVRPRTRVVHADTRWLGALSRGNKVGLVPGRVYLVDPLGYLMMRYEPTMEAAKILKDLKRLLNASRIG